jgi:hypothetical protein
MNSKKEKNEDSQLFWMIKKTFFYFFSILIWAKVHSLFSPTHFHEFVQIT